MQPTTDKIFVSYSRHDEAFARKIAVWLAKTLNMGVWIDIDDIQPGVKWSAAIQDGGLESRMTWTDIPTMSTGSPNWV